MKSKKRKQTTNGYTGYVSVPLLGTETYSEFIRLVQYYGDFVSEPVRKQIFSKPRWFKMELWIAVDGIRFLKEASAPFGGLCVETRGLKKRILNKLQSMIVIK